ncbi:MAG: hypothetical protein H6922_01175 [Pseudomonadaceae bacterium]|nr:hypothetical protein [Pseudomonadaceae bacterium]
MANEFETMMTQSRIELGHSAIKYSFLCNGGALVAMLAFIGNISANGNIQSLDMDCTKWVLGFFCLGLGAALFAFVFAYLSQTYFSNNNQSRGVRYLIATLNLIMMANAFFLLGASNAVLGMFKI